MGFGDGVAEGERERKDFTVLCPEASEKYCFSSTLSVTLNFFKLMCEMWLKTNVNKHFFKSFHPSGCLSI